MKSKLLVSSEYPELRSRFVTIYVCTKHKMCAHNTIHSCIRILGHVHVLMTPQKVEN